MMWIILFMSSFFELGFTVCLKLSEGFKKKKWTILCIASTICSIGMLSIATTELPLSIAYAVWTGAGTILITLFGIAVFKEKQRPTQTILLGTGTARCYWVATERRRPLSLLNSISSEHIGIFLHSCYPERTLKEGS